MEEITFNEIEESYIFVNPEKDSWCYPIKNKFFLFEYTNNDYKFDLK